MIERRWKIVAGSHPNAIEIKRIGNHGTYAVLQYRQQEEDWGGQNETPDMVYGEWQDVEITND